MPGASFTVAAPPGPQGAVQATPAAATRTFARRAEEVPAARRFIRNVLAGHPAALDAELLTSELVTNAVQHATDAGRVMVAVVPCGAVVHVKVSDDGRAGLPHWREACGHDETGRGFQLVNEIAERWGSSASRPARASGSRSPPEAAVNRVVVTTTWLGAPRCDNDVVRPGATTGTMWR